MENCDIPNLGDVGFSSKAKLKRVKAFATACLLQLHVYIQAGSVAGTKRGYRIMPALSDKALDLLKSLEGCRLTAYIDQAGVWTIGYGHTGHEVVPGLSWTQDVADAELKRDIEQFSTGVSSLIQKNLTDNQFSALVIFAFNIGLTGFNGSTALKRVNQGDLAGVPPAMLMWDKVHDPQSGQLVVSQGLVNRRNAEIGLWNTPVDPQDG